MWHVKESSLHAQWPWEKSEFTILKKDENTRKHTRTSHLRLTRYVVWHETLPAYWMLDISLQCILTTRRLWKICSSISVVFFLSCVSLYIYVYCPAREYCIHEKSPRLKFKIQHMNGIYDFYAGSNLNLATPGGVRFLKRRKLVGLTNIRQQIRVFQSSVSLGFAYD